MKEENQIVFNINESQCVKEYEIVGQTVYQNICTGQQTSVPWGLSGWLCFGFLIGLILTLIICCIIWVIGTIRD